MNTSRAAFLTASAAAGTLAATGLPETVAAATPQAGGDVHGMTFTMLRDGTSDHLGIRTPRGIIDVARAADALGISSAPVTTDDVVAGRGKVGALRVSVANAPARAIRG